MSVQSMKKCKACSKMTMHVQPATSHILHLILSLITFGLWIPIWVLLAASHGSQAQCTECGKNKGLFG
jgi:hypothetical protein